MSAEEAEKYLAEAFADLKTYQELLGVFTGACSMLYQTGVFDSERAVMLGKAFNERLQELMFASNTEGPTINIDQFINRFFRGV